MCGGEEVEGDVGGEDFGGEGLLEDCGEAVFEDSYCCGLGRLAGVCLGKMSSCLDLELSRKSRRGETQLVPRFNLVSSSSFFFPPSSGSGSSPAWTQYDLDTCSVTASLPARYCVLALCNASMS